MSIFSSASRSRKNLVKMINIPQTNREPKPFGFRFVAPLALGAALNPINSTMLAVAIVPIADSLHVGVAQAGWLIAGLYLAAAVAQPMMGRLVDLFGPRSVYLASLVFVAVAGVIGWRATSLASLEIARVVLGIGTSGAYPSAMRLFRLEGDRLGVAPPRFAMQPKKAVQRLACNEPRSASVR